MLNLSGVSSEVLKLNVCNFLKVFKKYCDFRNKLAELFVTDNQEGYITTYHGFLHFVAFFHVALLLSSEADNKKMGVDNEKALELDNRIIFSYFSLISM